MLRARMPPLPHLPEMVRLEEGVDFPAEVVDAVGVTKAAFNAGFPPVEVSEEIRPVGHGMMVVAGYCTSEVF
jgi:hypothetical protein